MKVALIGATGVVGRYVTPRLIAAGHQIRALVRKPGAMLTSWGVTCVTGDIFDARSHRTLLEGCHAVLHVATALRPRVAGAPDWALNDRIRRESVRLMLDACAVSGVKRVVQQSVAFVAAGAELADGTGPLAEVSFLKSAVEMEALVNSAALSSLIVRGGLLYGPGTGLNRDIGREMAAGLTVPGDGADWISLVHVADLAAALVQAVSSPATGIVAVTDDRPMTWRTWFEELAATWGLPAPETGGARRLPSFRVSNARARSALGWRPFFADYRHAIDEWMPGDIGRG